MPVTRLRQIAPLIQEAGHRISAELGYQSGIAPPSGIQKLAAEASTLA
jgi:hypothetical protein